MRAVAASPAPDDRGQLQRRRLGDRRHQQRDRRVRLDDAGGDAAGPRQPAGAGLRRHQRRRELQRQRERRSGLLYKWNFGDGTPDTGWSTSSSATHTYASPGTFVVTVYVKDDSGQERSRSAVQAVYLPATAKPPAASGNLLVENPPGANPRLWVVNQDNDSVSVFDAATLAKLGEVAVGTAPRSIARAPNGMIWVVAKQSGSLSVIDPSTRAVTRTITLARGSQPFGIVMSPVANVAYVTLEAGGQILKFDTTSYAQTGSAAIGLNARHLSISGDGARLYVSRFVTPPLPGEGTATVTPTASTGGEVLQLDATSLGLVRTIVLQHSDKVDGETQGRGIPNYLGAAVISPDGSQAYVPSKQDNVKRGALRDGTGLNFQNTVRAISSRIDLAANTEDLASRIDHDNASVASAAVYEPHGVFLFVALETSREVAVLDAFSRQERLRFDVGRAPQGLAISADGLRLYVSNFMDRTVGVYDLAPLLQGGHYSVPCWRRWPRSRPRSSPPTCSPARSCSTTRATRASRCRTT
jgi:YVTN family beta-propeller protein